MEFHPLGATARATAEDYMTSRDRCQGRSRHGRPPQRPLIWTVMIDHSPTKTNTRITTRFRRLGHWLLLATAATSILIIGSIAWSAGQRSRDLSQLEQAGAIFDDRTNDPSWIRLSGTTLGPDTVASLARLTQLEDLVLDESNVTDNDLKRLAKLTQLKRLSLVRTAVTNDGLAHLAHLPRLGTLILNSSYRVTDEGLDTLAQLESLEELSLLDTTVTLPTLIALSAQHDTLQIHSPHGVLGNRKLALSGTEITDAGLLRLHNAQGLQGLELPSRITDRGFRHLHQLADLKFLVAAGTAITDHGLKELLNHTEALEEIDLSRCNQLTDDGLAELATLSNLTQLKLDQTAAGPQLLHDLANNSELKLLSLDGCRAVNDRALEQLFGSHDHTHLQFLRISGTGITNASVQSLARNQLPALKGLDIRNTQVTSDHASRLRQRFNGCRVLH